MVREWQRRDPEGWRVVVGERLTEEQRRGLKEHVETKRVKVVECEQNQGVARRIIKVKRRTEA